MKPVLHIIHALLAQFPGPTPLPHPELPPPDTVDPPKATTAHAAAPAVEFCVACLE